MFLTVRVFSYLALSQGRMAKSAILVIAVGSGSLVILIAIFLEH